MKIADKNRQNSKFILTETNPVEKD